LLQKRAQPVQPRVPEFLIALEPFERAFHRAGLELALGRPRFAFVGPHPRPDAGDSGRRHTVSAASSPTDARLVQHGRDHRAASIGEGKNRAPG
jgi:hypothetical protein